MKSVVKLIFVMLLTIVASSAFALNLESDKLMYQVGDRAVLIASADSSALAGQEEYHAVFKINNLPIKFVKISDDYFAAILTTKVAGNLLWSVDLYSQDSELAKNTDVETINLNKEVGELKILKSTETDSQKIAYLNSAIASLNSQIQNINSTLHNSRTLVSTQSRSIVVEELFAKSNSYEDSVNFYPYASSVFAGQSIGFGLLIDADGFEEGLGYELLTKVDNSVVNFNEGAPGDLWYFHKTNHNESGIKSAEVKIFLFDLRAKELISNAILNGITRKIETQLLKDSTISTGLQSYYDLLIQDLSSILFVLSDLQYQMKTLAVTKSVQFEIVVPAPVTTSVAALSISEGQVKSYQISINKPPVSSVDIVIESTGSGVLFSVGSGIPSTTLTLTFDSLNWQTPRTVSVTIPDNQTVDGIRLESISHSVVGVGFEDATVPPISLSINDPQTPLVCSATDIYTTGYGSDYYYVSLPYLPSGPVEVHVQTDGDFLINYGANILYFDEQNWSDPQMVEVSPNWVFGGVYTATNTAFGDVSIAPCQVSINHTE